MKTHQERQDKFKRLLQLSNLRWFYTSVSLIYVVCFILSYFMFRQFHEDIHSWDFITGQWVTTIMGFAFCFGLSVVMALVGWRRWASERLKVITEA